MTFPSFALPTRLAVLAACLVAAGLANAQDAATPSSPDQITDKVFPPELIMRNQKALQMSETQKNAVIAEIKRAQTRIVDVQWDMQRALEPLVDQLGKDRPDEQQVLAQLDKVLAAEREFKRSQLSLAVRLKNLLSPEQQRQLKDLRASSPPAASGKPEGPR